MGQRSCRLTWGLARDGGGREGKRRKVEATAYIRCHFAPVPKSRGDVTGRFCLYPNTALAHLAARTVAITTGIITCVIAVRALLSTDFSVWALSQVPPSGRHCPSNSSPRSRPTSSSMSPLLRAPMPTPSASSPRPCDAWSFQCYTTTCSSATRRRLEPLSHPLPRLPPSTLFATSHHHPETPSFKPIYTYTP